MAKKNMVLGAIGMSALTSCASMTQPHKMNVTDKYHEGVTLQVDNTKNETFGLVSSGEDIIMIETTDGKRTKVSLSGKTISGEKVSDDVLDTVIEAYEEHKILQNT